MRYFMIYYIHKVRKNQKTRKEINFMSTKEMLEKIISNENVSEDVKEKQGKFLLPSTRETTSARKSRVKRKLLTMSE